MKLKDIWLTHNLNIRPNRSNISRTIYRPLGPNVKGIFDTWETGRTLNTRHSAIHNHGCGRTASDNPEHLYAVPLRTSSSTRDFYVMATTKPTPSSAIARSSSEAFCWVQNSRSSRREQSENWIHNPLAPSITVVYIPNTTVRVSSTCMKIATSVVENTEYCST